MRLILLQLVLVSSVYGQAEATRLCEVTLRAVSVAGVTQSYRVTSFKNDQGVDFSAHFIGLHGSIPCRLSPYSFELTWNLAQNEKVAQITKLAGTVSVYKPETWLTVATSPSVYVQPDGAAGSLSTSLPAGYLWRGRITPIPSEPLWVYIRSAVRSTAVVRFGDRVSCG